jgi:hypothetical protein
MKESKIKRVINVREYNGSYGTTFYHTLELENGDKGSIGKSKPDALKPGDVLRYEVDTSSGKVKFREPKTNRTFGSPRPAESKAAVALACATRLAAANITASGRPLEMNENLSKRITTVAGDLLKWLKTNE